MHTRTDSTQVNLTLISQTPLSTTRSSLILWQSPVPCPLHSMKRMARLWLWLDLSTHCINSCNKLALGLDQGLSGAKRGWRGGTGRVELESWVTTFLSLLAWLSKNVFRFPVWFSCHSFVKLFCFFFSFLSKDADVLSGVCERMCMRVRVTELTAPRGQDGFVEAI